jgi:hypothetical protein
MPALPRDRGWKKDKRGVRRHSGNFEDGNVKRFMEKREAIGNHRGHRERLCVLKKNWRKI